MKITIAGIPGSGKSSIAKLLAEKYSLKQYSMGGMRREFAISKGLTLEELNKLGEDDFKTDKFVDDFQKKLDCEDSFVIDGRLSYYFIPSSIKIFLNVSLDIGAERIFEGGRAEEKYSSIEETKTKIIERIKSDKKRYFNYYNINPYDEKHFDIIIDTSNKKVNDVLKILVRKIETFKRN
jgi:cytidylate kinase